MSDARPEDFLPLSAQEFQILLSLADQERHGYGIMQEVEARTGGELRLGPGTLYGAIKRMRGRGRGRGLIEEAGEREEGDERRRYYRLTALGRAVAVAEAGRLQALVEDARVKRLLPFPRSA
ncbi:MAG TPA: helix-turn-helix transcriptional regulator [Longimicrobiales bacterium]